MANGQLDPTFPEPDPPQDPPGGQLHNVTLPAQEFAGVRHVRACVAEDPGLEEAFAPDASHAVVTFKVPWFHRQLFRAECLGFAWFDPAAGPNGALFRWLPQPYPDALRPDTGAPFLFASRVLSCKGVGAFEDDRTGRFGFRVWPAYEFAYVTVLFESVFYPVLFKDGLSSEHERFVTKTEKPAVRVLTLERGTLEWENLTAGGNPVEVAHGVPLPDPLTEVEWVWHDVPEGAFNWDRVLSYRGAINRDEFGGHPAETLLLENATRKPRKSPVGLPTWEITFQFLRQERSWNKFRAPNGELDYLRYKGTGLRPHPTEDFNQLFLP